MCQIVAWTATHTATHTAAAAAAAARLAFAPTPSWYPVTVFCRLS